MASTLTDLCSLSVRWFSHNVSHHSHFFLPGTLSHPMSMMGAPPNGHDDGLSDEVSRIAILHVQDGFVAVRKR